MGKGKEKKRKKTTQEQTNKSKVEKIQARRRESS